MKDSRPTRRILLDGPKEYTGGMEKEVWLDRLAHHFKGCGADLRKSLEFWEKIESAKLYGLITVGFETAEGLENLRILVRKVEELG